MDINKKTEIIKMLNSRINNYETNREYSEKLMKLYTEVKESSEKDFKSYKYSVLNLFLDNILESFETCLFLIDNKRYKDAYIVGRKIIEILIREYYLANKNLYELYYRLKYKETAETFRRLLIGNKIETLVKTHWWTEREQILNDNIQFYEWRKGQDIKDIPNIEVMAKESGLIYLYQIRYGSWSKYVHCNMILEKDISNEKILNLEFLRDINTCMFEFIKKYSKELDIVENEILEFKNKNATLTSFNMTTGQLRSNVDITLEYINTLFGMNIAKEDEDKQFESTFFNTNERDYLRNEKSLKELIKEKELELKNNV